MLAQSVFRFVGGFVEPDLAATRAEQAAIAAIVGAPMHSIGAGVVENLVAVGARAELGSIALLSRAARIRLFAQNAEVREFLREIEHASASDDAALRPRCPAWRERNLVSGLREAEALYMRLPPEVTAVLRTCFRDVIGWPRMCQTLGRRTRYWLRRDVPPGELRPALDRMRIIFEAFPDYIGLQVLRAWCNAWPTTRRFIGGPRRCRWGWFAVSGDDILHYLACPAMRNAVAQCRHLRAPVWGPTGDVRIAFNLLPLSVNDVLNGALWLYLDARIYHAARHAPAGRIGSPHELLRAVRTAARSLVARCPLAGAHLRSI